MFLLVIACTSITARAAEPAPNSPKFLCEWGGQGASEGEFNFPIGIAINRADEVFVTDFYNARVQKFSSDGKFLTAFPVSAFPGGMAFDREENLYIAHAGIPPSRYEEARKRDKIAVFTTAGEPLREWGKFGQGDGEFDMPGGLAISRDDRVYVADQCNRRVQVFDTQGKFLTKWGRKGFEHGEFGGNPHPKAFFAGPTFVAVDEQGNVYTTEAVLGRVQKFSPNGKFLDAWGDNEVAPGKFGGFFGAFEQKNMQGPTGLAFDTKGRLWVNAIGGRIQRFTADGAYQVGFGEEGTKSGQFYAPHGIGIDSHGCLYVVDAFNHRIQKFAATP
ncbi:MAG TPA: hypothetical protein VHD36_16225 [Pirellulales bacterium]|nr:hypothetical protein [Pirellulales bacterium]